MSTEPIKRIQLITKSRWYWVWKPHGLPTTWWKGGCFLEICDDIFSQDSWRIAQKKEFSKDQERWLINRLDNDTAWYVWFVKSNKMKQEYLQLQKWDRVIKTYIASLEWHLWSTVDVDVPLMHHRMKERMICATPDQVKYWVWSLLFVQTHIVPVLYNKESNQTRVLVWIKKWARHQIRCHCSFLWHPIVWDVLYWNKSDCLQLYSIDLDFMT